MNRLLAVLLLVASTRAGAQAAKPGANNAESPSPEAKPSDNLSTRVEREQLKREVLDEVRKSLEKQKEEVRDEVRAQVATQAASRALEEEFQFHEEKKKLDLFEVNGYLRVRPDLLYQLDLRRKTDPAGFYLFPPPASDPERKTHAGTNMRWRLEPTLNVSEDVRIRAQVDMLDNVILGSTPSGGFGISQRTPWVVASDSQAPATADRNWLNNSIYIRRAYGEVNTPVGQFLFGRMASQWGLGILTSAGNCLDCDYGDTVDRLMFVGKIAGHYVVPMLTFTAVGPTSIRRVDPEGQPFDLDQLDDAHDYGIAIAKRDTDLEANRKLQAGQRVLNYGVYFTYRHQANDAAGFYQGTNPYGGDQTNFGFVGRDASIYIPDLWLKFQTKKLRLELEAVGVFGKLHAADVPGLSPDQNPNITLRQVGAVAQGEYKALDSLGIGLEVGFASGDKAPGMGNLPGRNGATVAGDIEGPQYRLVAADNYPRDTSITNYRFNRDYRVDLILWREILNGVTDALYVKPTVKYEFTEGIGFWASVIYSRAVFGESTPSSHLTNGALNGDKSLGLEIDGGLRYDSGDGFLVGVSYGALFPFAGLNNNTSDPKLEAKTAQAVRGWFVIKY